MTEQQELDEILEDFYDGDIRQSDMGKAKYAILDWHNKQIAKARLNEVQSAYEYWINGREFISSYFRERIAELSNGKEAEL